MRIIRYSLFCVVIALVQTVQTFIRSSGNDINDGRSLPVRVNLKTVGSFQFLNEKANRPSMLYNRTQTLKKAGSGKIAGKSILDLTKNILEKSNLALSNKSLTAMSKVTSPLIKAIPEPPINIKPAFHRVFNGRLYMLFPASRIWWLMGQKVCERYQGKLAVPYSRDIMDFMVTMIKEYYKKLPIPSRVAMWGVHIGVRMVQGVWLPESIPWCYGEPNEGGSCAELSTVHGFCFNDYRCSENRERAFICEVPVAEIDQPESLATDQRIICLQPRNYSRDHRLSSWFEAEKWCRELGMELARSSRSYQLPNRFGHRRAATAFDGTNMDGYWDTDNKLNWCSGHPQPDRQCMMHFGDCYRSIRCTDQIVRRYCCVLPVKI